MKFIYSCDIHGDKNKYEKLLELATESRTKTIVLAGDLLPKKWQNREEVQREFINGWFKDYLKRVNDSGVRFIAILGNDDVEAIEEDYNKMISEYENVYNIDGTKADIDGISFIGFSSVLDTPFYRKNRIVKEDGMTMPIQRHDMIEIEKGTRMITKEEWEKYRDLNIPTMGEKLNSLPEITEGNLGVFVFHDPPYGIGLDVCKDGDIVGSKDMLEYIKTKKPYLSLHGHVHESSKISGKWKEKVGNTTCMNCGQTEYGEKDLHFAAVDTDRNLIIRKIIPCVPEKEEEIEL